MKRRYDADEIIFKHLPDNQLEGALEVHGAHECQGGTWYLPIGRYFLTNKVPRIEGGIPIIRDIYTDKCSCPVKERCSIDILLETYNN